MLSKLVMTAGLESPRTVGMRGFPRLTKLSGEGIGATTRDRNCANFAKKPQLFECKNIHSGGSASRQTRDGVCRFKVAEVIDSFARYHAFDEGVAEGTAPNFAASFSFRCHQLFGFSN